MRRSLSDGLLLRHAVEGAEAEDQVTAGDADYFAVREELGEGAEGVAIVRIVERGDDYEFIGNVKVGVAGGEALAIEINWTGHGERFYAERVAVLILHLF
jgi:hypothetical protein